MLATCVASTGCQTLYEGMFPSHSSPIKISMLFYHVYFSFLEQNLNNSIENLKKKNTSKVCLRFLRCLGLLLLKQNISRRRVDRRSYFLSALTTSGKDSSSEPSNCRQAIMENPFAAASPSLLSYPSEIDNYDMFNFL